MAKTSEVSKAKLIVAIMYKDEKILNEVLKILKEKYAKIEANLDYDFNFTNYYEKETGTNLKKSIFVFKKYIRRESLPTIKLYTNKLEDDFSKDGKRTINIDPGYMTQNSVVLASAKELPHRVYLKKGIFADVILTYSNSNFECGDRTFPDYKTELIKNFFKIQRDSLKKEQNKKNHAAR